MPLAFFPTKNLGLKWASLRKGMQEFESRLALHAERNALDAKLRTVLPEEYQETYESIQPISMGSASLKFDAANRVAWDEIWDHFCDLAMAGGPPHKGQLLEPASPAAIDAHQSAAAATGRYREVVEEICRGIRMVSDLAVEVSPNPGWVRVMCPTDVMAAWMTRAIVMENVSAHLQGNVFELPAGPHFRLEKQIKNVVTVIAKTHHYFDGHIEKAQQRRIAAIFEGHELPLLQPARRIEFPDRAAEESVNATRAAAAARILDATGLRENGPEYLGWLGLECASVQAAIWMMRALVVNNTLARREDCCLYVPIHPILDPLGLRVSGAVTQVYRLAVARDRANG